MYNKKIAQLLMKKNLEYRILQMVQNSKQAFSNTSLSKKSHIDIRASQKLKM